MLDLFLKVVFSIICTSKTSIPVTKKKRLFMENNLKNSTVFTFFLDHIYWSSNGSPSIQMKLERGMLSWAAVFAFCRCEFRLKLLYTSVELRVPSIDENAFSQPALLPLPGCNHCDLLSLLFGLPFSFLFATSWCRQQDLHRGGLLSWWVGTDQPIAGNVRLLNLTVRTRNKLLIQMIRFYPRKIECMSMIT